MLAGLLLIFVQIAGVLQSQATYWIYQLDFGSTLTTQMISDTCAWLQSYLISSGSKVPLRLILNHTVPIILSPGWQFSFPRLSIWMYYRKYEYEWSIIYSFAFVLKIARSGTLWLVQECFLEQVVNKLSNWYQVFLFSFNYLIWNCSCALSRGAEILLVEVSTGLTLFFVESLELYSR